MFSTSAKSARKLSYLEPIQGGEAEENEHSDSYLSKTWVYLLGKIPLSFKVFHDYERLNLFCWEFGGQTLAM